MLSCPSSQCFQRLHSLWMTKSEGCEFLLSIPNRGDLNSHQATFKRGAKVQLMENPLPKQRLFFSIFLITGHSALFRIEKGRYPEKHRAINSFPLLLGLHIVDLGEYLNAIQKVHRFLFLPRRKRWAIDHCPLAAQPHTKYQRPISFTRKISAFFCCPRLGRRNLLAKRPHSRFPNDKNLITRRCAHSYSRPSVVWCGAGKKVKKVRKLLDSVYTSLT